MKLTRINKIGKKGRENLKYKALVKENKELTEEVFNRLRG